MNLRTLFSFGSALLVAAAAIVALAQTGSQSSGLSEPAALRDDSGAAGLEPPPGFAFATGQPQAAPATGTRFESVEIFVDSGQKPVSAYQLELKSTVVDGVEAKIVGIEGGDKAPYTEPPYYDPAALQGGRVILAAYSTIDAANLPSGKFRIARVHMQVSGESGGGKAKKPAPEYSVIVLTAATSDATPITVSASTTLSAARDK